MFSTPIRLPRATIGTVSSLRELEEAFLGLPEPDRRAERLILFLQEVFETTFSFDLESLQKKGLKQAAKQLSRYQAANDYIVSWVVQNTLGGHAIPLDTPTLRTVRRLGLVDDSQDDGESVRASLEHLVPKARGTAFGVIGENGSGKSTLLKLLAGITKPTRGSLEVRGRISALFLMGIPISGVIGGPLSGLAEIWT